MSGIRRAIDAVMRCTVCGAPMGMCDCWTRCPCGWSFEKGTTCRNPAHAAATLPGILVKLRLRTTNPLNGSRGNTVIAHAIKQRQRANERDTARAEIMAALARRQLRGVDHAPWVVRLTRISAGTMDTDGLAASQKGVRDGIAKALGIDDGDRARIRFVYEQRKGKRGEHAVEVLLVPRGGPKS